MYDLIIIGGGPAGSAAAVYAGRKRLKTLLITSEFGGQSIVSENIQNWIGDVSVSGADLARRFEDHVNAYKTDTLEILKATSVESITKIDENLFEVFTNSKTKTHIKTKTVLITTGSKRRKLEAKNADVFEHKGLTYCASCDGLFFAGQDVVVVGGGNAAFESALQLSAYCKNVTIMVRGDKFKAEQISIDAVGRKPNIKIIKNAVIHEIKGDQTVSSIIYTEKQEQKEMTINGIFVEIGQIPNTELAKNVCELDEFGRIKIDPWTQVAKPGVWAAGDCTNVKYHQNNIAAGDGVKAIEDIYQYLQN